MFYVMRRKKYQQQKIMSSKKVKESRTALAPITKATDVSFSIPEWKNTEIKSLHEAYQKEIYISVPLSLTDFESHDEVQFMSKPQKPKNDAFAYERQLYKDEDFGILVFTICMEQTILGEDTFKGTSIDEMKKKIHDLDLCIFNDIPIRFRKHYDNRVLKKILFQYINKGSYNVSLLEILLRRNHVLKFSLSLISKSLLKRAGFIKNYSECVSCFTQMKVCAEYFNILPWIRVREKSIESETFFISTAKSPILFCRKHKTIKKTTTKQKKPKSIEQKCLQHRTPQKVRREEKLLQKQKQKEQPKKTPPPKRSSSLATLIKKLICY